MFAQNRKTRLYEVLRRGRHVLLVSAVDVRTALESAGLNDYSEFLEVVTGGIGATPGKDKPGTFALVRPDGILAARGTRNDCEDVIGYLRLLFRGRQAKQANEHSSQVSSMGELIVT